DFKMIGDLFVGDGAIHIFKGSLDFQTDGYAAFDGHVDEDFQVIDAKADLNGFADPGNGDWGANFNGSVCVNTGLGCLGAAVSAAASNKGLALCGGIGDSTDFTDGIKKDKDFDASVGLITSWDDLEDATKITGGFLGPLSVAAQLAAFVVEHLHVPCNTGDISKAPPRAASARGGVAVRATGGLPTKTVTVLGHQGVPDVELQGPGGTLPGPAPGQKVVRTKLGVALALSGMNTVIFVLEKPKAGAWTVVSHPGSTALDEVLQSDGYRAAAPKARVTGKGRTRTLRYTVANLGAGQSVRFVEQGKFGTRVLGTAKQASGTLRINPANAPGGKRTVYGLVQRKGFTTDRKKLATYTAPGPIRPGAVRKLRARRADTSVVVTWKGGSNAKKFLVKLTGGHGLRGARLVPARSHKVTFKFIGRAGVKVSVAGLSKTLRAGPARTARLKQAPLIPKQKHKGKRKPKGKKKK
ncbi:MAG TPA: hypothetical protein VGI54_02070, partial [Solirubrobacteraceae bacterium]